MSFDDTAPGYPDKHRRSGEQRLDSLANSTVLKVLQSLITVVLFPIIAWVGSSMVDKMGKMEDSLNTLKSNTGVTELRIINLEREKSEMVAKIDALRERVIVLSLQVDQSHKPQGSK